MLYAGKTQKQAGFKIGPYLGRLSSSVKIWPLGQSAGNQNILGSSETVRKKLYMNLKQENVNPHNDAYPRISKHVTKVKPMSSTDWGWYLAGLIDGDGHFNKLGYLVLCLHTTDILCAHKIKTYIGYGTISPVHHKNAYTYVLSHPRGRARLAGLIHNKLKHKSKIFQYNHRFGPKLGFDPQTVHPKLSLETYWLCGWIQSDGSFQVKVLSRPTRKNLEFRTVLQIDQKEPDLCYELQSVLGGYVGFRASQNTYYYSTVSFHNGVKLINYLDRFCLQAGKRAAYRIWRRCYVSIQQGDHLTPHGAKTILRRKRKLNNHGVKHV